MRLIDLLMGKKDKTPRILRYKAYTINSVYVLEWDGKGWIVTDKDGSKYKVDCFATLQIHPKQFSYSAPEAIPKEYQTQQNPEKDFCIIMNKSMDKWKATSKIQKLEEVKE